jgi:hypothetical protein
MSPINALLATVVIVATFYAGWSYRDYQVKSALCQGLAFGRTVTPSSPCAPYV